ncbi:unnamed protein product, partial [Staurois parvus]
ALPLVARDVNHQVPAGDSLPVPGDHQAKLTGERPVCKQHRSLPPFKDMLLCISLSMSP